LIIGLLQTGEGQSGELKSQQFVIGLLQTGEGQSGELKSQQSDHGITANW